MKKNKILIVFILIFVLIFGSGCVHTTTDEGYKLIRIHIRADSNDEKDQNVKLKVRDAITLLLETKLDGVTTFDAAYSLLSNLLEEIEKTADKVLKNSGFDYRCHAKLNNEFFPTRSYEGIVVESGYYDALILELGSGKGDNWWCVIYPPLCYLEAGSSDKFAYKSKIKELWDKFMDTFR